MAGKVRSSPTIRKLVCANANHLLDHHRPSGDCCLKGHLHEGNPRGKFEKIADVDTYITAPQPGKSNGHILFYYADVYGMFINAQLVMDEFADAGYLVLGLDYFNNVPNLSLEKLPGF